MVNNWVVKIILFPFSLLYGLGVSIRNGLYSVKLLKAVKFSVPIISIGNITIGGTGKTPHVEYLIRLLQPYINVATMSRGYGRKTTGFRMVTRNSTVREVGDEPLQFKLKYPNIPVSVAENRALGIPQLLGQYPQVNAVILDDGFQHLSVKPHMNILLTTFKKPYYKDFLMPSGRLREWSSGAMRATAVIVTKCPSDITDEEREVITRELELKESQALFFSTLDYGLPYSFFNPQERVSLDTLEGAVVLSAIADSEYMEDYVTEHVEYSMIMSYADHHDFSSTDISRVIENYQSIKGSRKVVLTTEKDAVRLLPFRDVFIENKVPVFLLPIQVRFIFNDIHDFDNYIKEELLKIRV